MRKWNLGFGGGNLILGRQMATCDSGNIFDFERAFFLRFLFFDFFKILVFKNFYLKFIPIVNVNALQHSNYKIFVYEIQNIKRIWNNRGSN